MKIIKNKEKIIVKKIIIGAKCDYCKEEIKPKDKWDNRAFFEVTTHHSDWGNDSCDSFEESDICSIECLMPHMEEYFKKANGSEEYEIERHNYSYLFYEEKDPQ